ncbi:hypothetical protein NI401_13620 [Acinetobacter indicus]|uniref:hypothetical protein n=1 Tax=Acinetobacter indicus TaxID=756892 RepID=UPI00209B9BB0|nr:hypothetical protein [Acinetobacter indicus]MCO8103919.1 hypothetical protein [Acinetobacter indicus]
MKKILLLLLISSTTFATELKLKEYPKYRIEYDPKTQTIKILSKKNSTKECDKEAQNNSTKKLIERNLKDRSKKTIVNFTCYL